MICVACEIVVIVCNMLCTSVHVVMHLVRPKIRHVTTIMYSVALPHHWPTPLTAPPFS